MNKKNFYLPAFLTSVSIWALCAAFTFSSNGKIEHADNPPPLKLALLKYAGGGDWYNDVNSLHNLAAFCNTNLGMNFDKEYVTVEAGGAEIFSCPFVYMTGHGNVVFGAQEAENMRNYLIGGGFLFINDDYGMDPFIRPALKKVFPELELVELPFTHPIFHQKYEFPNGIPKIHEHDGKPPKAYGLFWQNRLVAFYNYESDLGDGWDDVHHDPEEIRTQALKMGANIVQFVFQQGGDRKEKNNTAAGDKRS